MLPFDHRLCVHLKWFRSRVAEDETNGTRTLEEEVSVIMAIEEARQQLRLVADPHPLS
jgi:hypothetical protein